MTIPLGDRLRTALPAAMKARDGAAVTALRSALAAIENAAAVPAPAPVDGRAALGLPAVGLGVTEVPRRVLDDAEVERIVRAEVSERLAAADEYDCLGKGAEAGRLRDEARALTTHLSNQTPAPPE